MDINKPVAYFRKNRESWLGLTISIPVSFIIYAVSLAAIKSNPTILLIVLLGLALPTLIYFIAFNWAHKQHYQYKNFHPNKKLPQCAAASTSAIISGLGIGDSLPGEVDLNMLFTFLSILLLGSFTILSIADGHGVYKDNPKNCQKIRDNNNKVQAERMSIFKHDIFLCLILPLITAVLIKYWAG